MHYSFILVILLVVILLIVTFGVAIYIVITRLYRQLRKREAEAIESIITAQERERTTISREVHDNLGPMLSITQMQIGYLTEQMEASTQKDLLLKMQVQVQEAIKQCRNISHMISSEVSSSKSLQAVLQEQITNVNEFGNIDISLSIPEDLPVIDPVKGTSLIRIFQELLVNTVRHADATLVDIKIEKTPDYLFLSYQDNGKGFQLKSVSLGLGIQNITKRIEIIGGKQLWNELSDTSGMNLQILLPLQKIIYESTNR
ncbi:histidine kinase [Fluviicola sp.]|uniref:sensor histidine kinase n=1 Tax=Fluviicola sp. TaxID=1917219 RepID=UPI002631CCF2|nr:histidine kinase [Fluviicola sp.]